MYKIGDIGTFAVSSVSDATNVYAFVWHWWDGLNQTTSSPFAIKVINIGGNPVDSQKLHYTCSPVLIDGQTITSAGTISAVNSPFLTEVGCTNNDDYYGYQTVLSLKAYTINGNALSYAWYSGTVALGAGTNGSTYPVEYTWRGNDVAVSGTYTAQENHFSLQVLSDRTLSCVVTDTTAAEHPQRTAVFSLRGKPVPSMGVTLSAEASSVTADASSPQSQRIGIGQELTYACFARDIDGLSPEFIWNFAGSYGWTVPAYGGGNTQQLPDGSFSCTYIKDISGELVDSGNTKQVRGVCTVRGTNTLSRSYGQQVSVAFSSILVANAVPSRTEVTCVNAVTGAAIALTSTVAAGTKLRYLTSTTDPENDVVVQRWKFSGLAGLYSSPSYFYGPQVIIDTTGFSSTPAISIEITSTDRLGAVLVTTVSGPLIS